MPLIEFLARTQDLGRYPRPYPANKAIPDWVKSMPRERGGGPTLKHCPPLLEAMTAGYIIPAPCDVTFTLTSDAKLSWQAADNHLIAAHHRVQYEGAPFENELIVKFINPWVIRTPEGYSTLITAPLNRFSMPFIPLSGVVETESYYREVHLPTISIMRPGTQFQLNKGDPLVQAIPFRRESWTSQAGARDEAKRHEADKPFLVPNARGVYKGEFWRKHEYD
jgi:hypothetical protein